MINISVVLCLIAGFFGIFALIKYFCILKPHVYTNVFNVVPIIIGTLAWLSAGITFYNTQTYDSPIDFERTCMIASWIMLILRIKTYRNLVNKPNDPQ